MNFSKITDSEILDEYVRRFTIPAGEPIRSAKEAADHFRCFYSDAAKVEKFSILYLNSQNQVLSTETLFEGSLNTSAVYPRRIVERILDIGCGAIVIAHNHPSGGTTPSASDRAVTKKLQTALGAIDVDLLDHIIIGGANYYSFADNHLL